ncbi:MAG: DUF305 domain-containing protein [Vicinamibacterales bacterium]
MVPDASPDSRRSRSPLIAIAVVAALIIGAAGGAFFSSRGSGAPPAPGPDSAEAGFARDMQVHHIQGVELAMIIRDRTDDEDMRRMAYDMATTQGHQAGQLYGWLAAWGLNQLGSQPPMAWMGHTGHGMGALMPGMATPEQVQGLSAASGVDAERMFLRLMIAHHQGALEMSNAVLERSQHPVVRAFATAVLTSQQAEIDVMTSLLAAREGP